MFLTPLVNLVRSVVPKWQVLGRQALGRQALGPQVLAIALCASTAGLARECPPTPAAVVDINSNRFYSDRANSIVDPALVEKRKASVKPLEDFRAEVARFASRGLAGNRNWSQCTGRWLVIWAQGGALLGRMNKIQAHYERKWALAAFSMAYLMVKPELTSADHAVIEPWLDSVATEVVRDYETRKARYNNHYYWLGFALGASATATGNTRHWGLAAETYREAMKHIEADGSLPKEAARAGMSLHYHAFSLQPLVMLAELAARRGEDWYGIENGAIHRLAALTLAGFRDPAPMTARTGIAQKPLTRANLAWLTFYARRFPGRLTVADVLAGGDIWYSTTGGNMSLLAARWVP